ncbi:MAG: hypothetical protein KAS72_07000 [Phycisphaerales bacterium]|nr:hypothetical protein [Phycisphaerales bacterium]
MRAYLAFLGVVVASACATTHGATFSFASDTNADDPTWDQQANILTDYADLVFVDLLVDIDEDGPLDAVEFNHVRFDAEIELQFVSSVPMPGGLFLHIFEADGWFMFDDAAAGPVLSATFFDAAFTALGPVNMIGSSAALQGFDANIGAVHYTPGQPLIDLGLTEFTAPEDFAFTLTDINDGMGAPLDAGVLGPFDAEGSYSGSAVPAPGSLALLALGSLLHVRRRH